MWASDNDSVTLHRSSAKRDLHGRKRELSKSGETRKRKREVVGKGRDWEEERRDGGKGRGEQGVGRREKGGKMGEMNEEGGRTEKA